MEDIDLLFGERALGTLPDNLHKGPIPEIEPSPVGTDVEAPPKNAEPEGEAV